MREKMSRIAVELAIAGVLIAALVVMILYFRSDGENGEGQAEQETIVRTDTQDVIQTDTQEGENDRQTTTDASLPAEPVMLPHLEELYSQNPDLAGWIKIPDTVVDYPVMYTPEDGEKYIYADFKGKFNVAGLPFMEDDCSMDPESDNLIIYGHNMKNGSMFASLLKYKKESYWKEHPVILFSTLYEEREYEIIAAFYDRVYYQYEDCFKFYQFINARDKGHFEEAMTYYSENALYDTGVTAEYGDRLITLVTCAYHMENGRFVVVAREKVNETRSF